MSCYFCNDNKSDHKKIIDYNGLLICNICKECILSPIKYNITEINICSFCDKPKHLIELQFSNKVCIECCKTIYFGRNKKEEKCCIIG
jgi:hypothetical protein